jgi:hypothetical protein
LGGAGARRRELVEHARALEVGAHVQVVVEEALFVISQRHLLRRGALDDAVWLR